MAGRKQPKFLIRVEVDEEEHYRDLRECNPGAIKDQQNMACHNGNYIKKKKALKEYLTSRQKKGLVINKRYPS